MSFTYRYRKIIMFVIVTLMLGSISFFSYSNNFKGKTKTSKKKVLLASKNKNLEKKNNEEKENYYKVDIKGQVNNPGIYTLKIGSRVSDVIELAGGLTENANTTVTNLSKKILDEMVIIIYSNEEVEDFKKTKEIEKQVIEKCNEGNMGVRNDSCIENSSENSISNVININTATKEELITLPGIGESKADNIIKYREEQNGFKDINELKGIDGIGENIFDKIKENITI